MYILLINTMQYIVYRMYRKFYWGRELPHICLVLHWDAPASVLNHFFLLSTSQYFPLGDGDNRIYLSHNYFILYVVRFK